MKFYSKQRSLSDVGDGETQRRQARASHARACSGADGRTNGRGRTDRVEFTYRSHRPHPKFHQHVTSAFAHPVADWQSASIEWATSNDAAADAAATAMCFS